MKVAVFGALGRMGAEVVRAVEGASDLELVAALDAGDDRTPAASADVVVDFTVPSVVMDNIAWCLEHGVHIVVGTSGFTAEKLDEVRALTEGKASNVLIAANFSIGALLMMKFAEIAARHYETVEVIELHHPNKVDAPSGTATATATRIAEARRDAGLGEIPDATTHDPGHARGAVVDGVHVHGVRLRGLFAHQEVVFGNAGEMLTIREDSFERSAYMPGVLAAVRAVPTLPGLTFGIEGILGID